MELPQNNMVETEVPRFNPKLEAPLGKFTDLVLWRRRHYSWRPDEIEALQHLDPQAA